MAAQRSLHDAYFRQAKREGYVARSAYKLIEINEKKKLVRRGDRALDLGCAPGSWLQVLGKLVGSRGIVVGVDLKAVDCSLPEHVHTLVGDVFELKLEDLPGGVDLFDVVVSDMAPNTSGDLSDHFRSVDLCNRVLDVLPGLLKPGGNLAMKVFEGEAYPELLSRTGGMFRTVKGFKPKASRDVSREMYVVASFFTQ